MWCDADHHVFAEVGAYPMTCAALEMIQGLFQAPDFMRFFVSSNPLVLPKFFDWP